MELIAASRVPRRPRPPRSPIGPAGESDQQPDHAGCVREICRTNGSASSPHPTPTPRTAPGQHGRRSMQFGPRSSSEDSMTALSQQSRVEPIDGTTVAQGFSLLESSRLRPRSRAARTAGRKSRCSRSVTTQDRVVYRGWLASPSTGPEIALDKPRPRRSVLRGLHVAHFGVELGRPVCAARRAVRTPRTSGLLPCGSADASGERERASRRARTQETAYCLIVQRSVQLPSNVVSPVTVRTRRIRGIRMSTVFCGSGFGKPPSVAWVAWSWRVSWAPHSSGTTSSLDGTAAALVFNQVFFPSFEPLVGTPAGVHHLRRRFRGAPAGGVVFGTTATRWGARTSLSPRCS